MLSFLIWFPIFAAIIIFLIPGKRGSYFYCFFALSVSLITFIYSLVVAGKFDVSLPAIQLRESFVWLKWLGLTYDLGIDGLSLPLVILNSFLTSIAIYVSKRETERPRFYYALILLLMGSVNGAFLAQNLLLFFLFYEIEIVPLYFLIAVWGGNRRGYAATKFLLYTALSGILILISFLGLVWFSGESTFAFEALKSHSLPVKTQILLLIPLLIGLFIKIPIFPFHTWLPDAHVEASTPISVLLAGVLLKLGTYALLRFGVGLFLQGWVAIAPYLAYIAANSALYGAMCAISQKDMKKVVAFSSIAHMAYVLLAASATTRLSLQASILQMVSHGLISALLFILVGIVYETTGSRDVDYLRGLLNPQKGLPITGSLMILGVMASAGIPGMIGFISEFLVFRGSFPIFPIPTLLCMVGTGLTAVYFLLMINKVFFGRLTPELANLPPVSWLDEAPAIILASLIVLFGLQPHFVTGWSDNEAVILFYGSQETVSTIIPGVSQNGM